MKQQPNRAGWHRTNLPGSNAAYTSFTPAPLPPNPPLIFDAGLVDLTVRANASIARLEATASLLADVNPLIGMYVRKEALLSAQIEGSQATLEELLDPHAATNVDRTVADVVNYVRAIEYAVLRLDTLPLSGRLLREAHEILMEGVRGGERTPGAFRTSQNWIGAAGTPLADAAFVPPSPEDVAPAMSQLEHFMNTETELDPLVAAALIHYQFETIHPFLDGNGRIGRLLVTLYLISQRALTTPALYLSHYLKVHRAEYYDRLMAVRLSGNYEQWVAFFLRAVTESAEVATNTLQSLAALHEDSARAIAGLGRASATALRLLRHLESAPIVTLPHVAEALEVSFVTASKTVAHLVRLEILEQTSSGKRNRVFSYTKFLEVLGEGV